MAGYAALVSVMHILEQIQHHPRPPISLDENQVQSLTENVAFLQEFFEAYSHVHFEGVEGLQSRIAEAAYEAEDVIESRIVDQILAHSPTHEEGISSISDFYQGLQKVIQDMDLIIKEVVEIKKKMGSAHGSLLYRSSFVPTAGSSRSPSMGQNAMVGFDDVLIQLMDKLTGQQSSRQIIPIVGMGGIGKTTLAKNAYENPLIVQYFDICAWVTISQEYSVKEILLEVLSCRRDRDKKENLSGKSEEELGQVLYKSLFDRRYLIIMDDVWNIEVWDNLKFFLPDNNNRSRIVITTRLSNIALHLPSTSGLEMNFLNEELSWNLLCKTVFGEDRCPLELEQIGKKIAKNCKGLPLSIVVIGGLLAKTKQTIGYWKDIAENLSSIVNLEDNERCFKLLYMSYNHLPVHLKPCFLYMGVFPEDSEICVSNLIKQWVAEGFLKPIIGKSLEEVAEEYLKDLIDRNLILILRLKSNGKMKFCKIHDLLRDLCLREVQKEKFLCVTKPHNFDNFPHGINLKRRIAIHGRTAKDLPQVHDALQSASLARSLIWKSPIVSSQNFRLLRLLKTSTYDSIKHDFFRQVNLRYLVVDFLEFVDIDRTSYDHPSYIYKSPIDRPIDPFDHSINPFDLCRIPSVYLLWNLQTLIIRDFRSSIEIWKMPLLRHVKLHGLLLPDPSDDFSSYGIGMTDEQDDIVLGNLQTLSNVENFQCSEKMVKMIPNIKKLKVSYYKKFEGSRHCLNNLGRLHKLESLSCCFLSSAPNRSDLMQNLAFPHSLKKLTLKGCHLRWEDISKKIGSLPFLEVLKLKKNSFSGAKWETVEEQFLSLKYLLIEYCGGLECWTTDSTHFPCLEHLVLRNLGGLKEIPLCIGDIPTLQSIELHLCRKSVILSAKQIVEEQEELGNQNLQVQVIIQYENRELRSLASHNFQVKRDTTSWHYINDPADLAASLMTMRLRKEVIPSYGCFFDDHEIEEGGDPQL